MKIRRFTLRSVGLLSLIASGLSFSLSPAGATSTTYSIDRSVTVAPSTFAGATSGGDGYDVGFYQDKVFNVFHHESSLQVMCVYRESGAPCVTSNGSGISRTVSATVSIGQSGSFQLTDIVVNGDGTLNLEAAYGWGSYGVFDGNGNMALPLGTAITLSGVDPSIDGQYHIGSFLTSSHDRLMITTVEAPASPSAPSYCNTRLGNGLETDPVLNQVFYDVSDGTSCAQTWTGYSYARFSDVSPQDVATSFGTSAKPTLYIDAAHGYLFVAATLDASVVNGTIANDAADSYLTPGIVCVDLNAYLTSTNPGCNGVDQPSTWVAIGSQSDISTFAGVGGSASYGLGNMMAVNGNLYVFNPVSHAGQPLDSTQNALLCYSLSTYSACPAFRPDFGLQPHDTSVYPGVGANELSLSNDTYGTPFFNPEPATSATAIGSRIYIPMDAIWTSPYGSTFRYTAVACVDVSDPAQASNCIGSWPLTSTDRTWSADVPVIPYLAPSGTTLGACYAQDGVHWRCVTNAGQDVASSDFDPSALNAALALPAGTDHGSGYSPSPLVVGTQVFMTQLTTTNRVACYDFATDAACALSGGSSYPLNLSVTAPYAIEPDPQIPGCLWVNSDGGSSRATSPTIINFNAATGGACSYQGTLASVDFVVNRPGCAPTSITQFAITTNAQNHLRQADVEVVNASGTSLGTLPLTAGGSSDLTSSSLSPEADFTSVNTALSSGGNVTFHLHLITSPSSDLTAVTVHAEWTAARAGCTLDLPQAPTSLHATPSSGSASFSWSAPSAGPTPTLYTLTVPGKGSCTVDLIAHPSAPLSCTISGLNSGVTYSATVVASTIAGDSSASSAVSFAITSNATPFTAYVHGWTYAGADLTGLMRKSINAIAHQIVNQHCTKVKLTGYSNFSAKLSLSQRRADTVAQVLRADLNRLGASSVRITTAAGGSTTKFSAVVLNRAVVVRAS